MKILFTLSFVLFISFSISAQLITVVDMRDHEPIEDVFIMSDELTSISNANGKVSFKDTLKEGDTLVFQHPSFITIKLSYQEIIKNKNLVILERKTISLEEFTVSAHKWEQKTDELPLRIQSVHRDALSYQPGTTADLLGNTGEIFIQKSQQGGGSPMFRGFAANSILLVYNGTRVNNAIFRSGNLQNIILFDPKAMESTEVVFGPGSTIYGSDALGGVIDYRSISPKFSADNSLLLSGLASIGFASASKEGNGHIHFGIGGEKLSSVTSFSFSQFGNLRMGVHGPEDYLRPYYAERINNKDTLIANANDLDQVESGYMQVNFIQKFGYKLSPNTEMEIHFSLAQTGDVPRYDRLIQENDTGDGLRYSEWYYGPNSWINTGISFMNESSTMLADQWKMQVDYQYYAESRHDRWFGSDELRNRSEKVNGINFNFDLNKYFSKSLQLYYGAEIWHNKVGSEGNQEDIRTGELTEISTRYPDGSNYTSGGIYAMFHWNLSAQWIFNAGLRYSYATMNGTFDPDYFPFPQSDFKQNNQALTPSIGLVYKANSQFRVLANVGQGFRAPNIDDVAKVFDSSPGNVVVPNTELTPESVWSFDLGFTWLPTDRIQLEASGFYSILQDVMVRADYSFNGQDSIIYDGEMSNVEAIQNLGSGWIYGVESSLKVSLNSNFSFLANIVYTQGEDGENDPLRHVTPLMTSAHLIYLDKKFKIDLNGRYNGEFSNDQLAPSEKDKAYLYAMDSEGKPYSPSWYELNLQGSWFVSSMVRLDLALENLLNARYRTYSSGIAAAGFNVKISAVAHF
jgi:hemoglobin/transferrin/lactoferrin receptor protein